MDHRIQESLNRLIEMPKRRAAEPPPARTLLDLKLEPCTMRKEDYDTVKKALTVWAEGARLVIELSDNLTRIGKDNMSAEQWRKSVRSLNDMLDALEPYRSFIDTCTKYAAKLTLLNQSIVRIYDQVDDYDYAQQISTELAAAFAE